MIESVAGIMQRRADALEDAGADQELGAAGEAAEERGER